jgi:hypothetical protein
VEGSAPAGRESLGAWILARLLAILVIVFLFSLAPSTDCDGGGSSNTVRDISLLFVFLASVGAFVAGANQMGPVGRGTVAWYVLWICAAAAILGAASGLLFLNDSDLREIDSILIAGAAATVVALVGLLVALFAKLGGVESLRPLLAVYLIGLGVFCFPALGFIGLSGKSGIGC